MIKVNCSKTILHLTPHVGGGVGAVLADLVMALKDNDCFHTHKIACLDNCHEFSRKRFQRLNVDFKEGLAYNKHLLTKNIIDSADLVIVHYWNHPLLTNMLVNQDIGLARFLVWCHGSGLNEPSVIPNYLFDLSEKLIFSSKISYLSPNLQSLIEINDTKFQAIRSARDLKHFIEIGQKRKTKKFKKKLLYVGTVSYQKLHLDFLKIITKLALLGFEITVVGGSEQDKFKKQISENIKNKILFTGEVFDVKPFYKDSDIFIYPLKKNHYGTGEQVLQEAMACGLPPVTFDNPSERDLIDNNNNGFLVSNSESFVDTIIDLSSDSAKYKKMSYSCIHKAKNQFSIHVVATSFQELINHALQTNKRKYISKLVFDDQDLIIKAMLYSSFHYPEKFFDHDQDSSRFNIFKMYEYINTELFKKNLNSWISISKGTPKHYLRFFPDSEQLHNIVHKINLINDP